MTKWISNGVEFKVGDKVKVARKPGDEGGWMGGWDEWQNVWADVMDDSIGKIFTIEDIHRTGVEFVEDIYSYPLSVLEKVSAVNLPSGDFKLIGKDGIEYLAGESSFSDHVWVEWKFPIDGTELFVTISNEKVLAAIKSGFWHVQKSSEQLQKEATLAKIKEQQQLLTNEIEQLEKELAQW